MTSNFRFALITGIMFISSTGYGYAATKGEVLSSLCPHVVRAKTLEQWASEAAAVGDEAKIKLYREAALIYFQCSTSVTSQQYRDLAYTSYASDIFAALDTNGDALKFGALVDSSLNEIAFRSKDPQQRYFALLLRYNFRCSYREAYNTVNGSYPDGDAPALAKPSEPTSQPALDTFEVP